MSIKNLFKVNLNIKMLNIYHDETDTVIAYNPEDAVKVWEEFVGDSYETDSFSEGFSLRCSLFDKITVRYEDIDFLDAPYLGRWPLFSKVDTSGPLNECGGNVYVTATALAWILSLGRSFLCSTEW